MLSQHLLSVSGSAEFPPLDPDVVLVFDTSLGDGTEEIGINLGFGSAANVVVDWGDDTSNAYTTSGAKYHTYDEPGIYEVRISGTLQWFRGTVDTPHGPKLIECQSLGDLGITNLTDAFRSCPNLRVVPRQLPSTVTNLLRLFQDSSGFTADVTGWDTSNITEMPSVFINCYDFNQNIINWNTSNVTNMSSMFQNNYAFNRNISNWDTGNVTSMQSMFNGAFIFNQPIGGWDTSSVTNMNTMFRFTFVFNQNLTGWCVSNITSEPFLFGGDSVLSPSNYPIWGTCP
jgi:surface protein